MKSISRIVPMLTFVTVAVASSLAIVLVFLASYCFTSGTAPAGLFIVNTIGILTLLTLPGLNRQKRNAASVALSRIGEPVLRTIL